MRKIRMGMVGGGPGAFIGEVHRKAARLDGGVELVAGVFSRDEAKNRQAGEELKLDAARVYSDYRAMLAGEAERDDAIDFVAIVTPNNAHFETAMACLDAGFHVMCEKPMTLSLQEALQLRDKVQETGLVFGVMHNYTGYPMVKLARDMVRQGDLGRIIKVVVQYPQEWLCRPIELDGQTQAAWRTDPQRSGIAGAVGDIGTHAANLAEYITGLEITELCADLTSFIPGRRLDDDGNCLLRFEQGAKGLLEASQVSIGEQNNLAIRVYGTEAAVEWHQEEPNQLYVRRLNAPTEIWSRGFDYVAQKSAAAGRATRLPSGHPEAFIEAFANNYLNFTATIAARLAGEEPSELLLDFPDVNAGVRGMAFIEAMVKSSGSQQKWTKIEL